MNRRIPLGFLAAVLAAPCALGAVNQVVNGDFEAGDFSSWMIGPDAGDTHVNCLSFGGSDDYVSIPDHNDFDITTNITVEAWIKPAAADLTRDMGSRTIVEHETWSSSTSGGYFLFLESTSPSDDIDLAFRLSEAGDPYHTVSGVIEGMAAAGEWAHVAGTYDGTTMRVFFNGTLVGSAAESFTIGASTRDLSIGQRGSNPAHGFAGSIDEVRISNNTCRYTAAFTPPTDQFTVDADTVALYHLFGYASTIGSTVVDETAGAHDGTLQGTVLPQWEKGDVFGTWVRPAAGYGGGYGALETLNGHRFSGMDNHWDSSLRQRFPTTPYGSYHASVWSTSCRTWGPPGTIRGCRSKPAALRASVL